MNKREVIDSLYEIWAKNPELRLSQLIWNAFQGDDFFYVEDTDFTNKIEDSVK